MEGEKLSPVQPELVTPTNTNTDEYNATKKRSIPDMGNHLILDFVDVDFDLNNYELLDAKLREVLSSTSVHIEGSLHKKFEPQGVTIIYLLSESHFSIHTWPETRSCAIDFYHCGPISNQNLIIAEEKLCDAFGWENCTTGVLLQRGSETSYLANKLIAKSEIYKNIKFVHREKSQFQDIRVYDTETLGRILVLDHAI
jgi:S-adenosylmethionine decarboxylase proenzyme